MLTKWVHIGLLSQLLWIAACKPDLAHSHRNLERLCIEVLDALRQQDGDALRALMVTREEHRDLLWQQLPSSQHFEFDYVRSLNERNSSKAIRNALNDYGGADFEFVSIEFTEPSEQYDGFTLHFGAQLMVRRASDGEEGILPILDVVLEYDGRWKLMNYDE
jgi:hypothetical protein